MGKDTVVIRSEVSLSVKNPLIKYPEEVRKYYLQYGPCEVLHSVCKKLLNSTQYVVILQFKQSSHANQVKQKYNGRVLGDSRVTTCWFDAKQARELGLPPPPLHQAKKGPQWNRYTDDSLSVSTQDSVRGVLTSQDFSESDSSQVLGRLTPEMEQPSTPGLWRSRAASPPARSLSKERHDSLERPDSQLSTYSHSSRERGQVERRERASARERSESLSSSRCSVRFGSRNAAEEKEFSHHSEGGTRKRRASSPANYSGSKRSKEDVVADEKRTNIFDRLGPSSSLKDKQHQLEEVFSTSSGTKGSSSGAHLRSSLSDRFHTSPGPSSDYEQRSYLGEYVSRRRGRELMTVKEEFEEKSGESRERRRKMRSEGYREAEREERERGRGRERESVWEREKEKERSRERHRERNNEEDAMKEDRSHGRGGVERRWHRERELESEGDILWEHNDIDERREEGSEEGRRQNTDGRREEERKCLDAAVGEVKTNKHASTFGEVLDGMQLSSEEYGEEIIERKVMDKAGEKEEEEAERRRGEEKKARDKERVRHRKGRERRDKDKVRRTKSAPGVKEEVGISETEAQPTSEVAGEKSADDELSPAALPESRDYNDRDVTPPLEVLQSLQNSYQQTYYSGQFHPLPVPTSSDVPYQIFGGHEHLQQLPQPAQGDPAIPTTSLGYQVGAASGSGVMPTTGGWAVPTGVSPAQWQLWLQSFEKQPNVATGSGVLTATAASETQASSEQLGGSLEGVSVPMTTETSVQAETTPTEVEAAPPQPRLSVSSLSAEQVAPPQQKRKLDAKCKAQYREMMQTFKTHAAVLATATKLMIQENPDKQMVLEEALEASLCRFAQTLLEKFQQQT